MWSCSVLLLIQAKTSIFKISICCLKGGTHAYSTKTTILYFYCFCELPQTILRSLAAVGLIAIATLRPWWHFCSASAATLCSCWNMNQSVPHGHLVQVCGSALHRFVTHFLLFFSFFAGGWVGGCFVKCVVFLPGGWCCFPFDLKVSWRKLKLLNVD